MIVELKLPKYKVTLPISGISVEFRPFTVKEEKILLLAKEENDVADVIRSIGQIISNCTFGKCDIETLKKVDAEYLFIQIRNKSMGEGVDITATCKECSAKTEMTINFDNIRVKNIDKVENKPIQITEDVWITVTYPSIKESMSLPENDGISALALALDTIIEGEDEKKASDYTMAERVELIESFTSEQLNLFKPFLDGFPTLILDIVFTCKCGYKNEIAIEGIESFFV